MRTSRAHIDPAIIHYARKRRALSSARAPEQALTARPVADLIPSIISRLAQLIVSDGEADARERVRRLKAKKMILR